MGILGTEWEASFEGHKLEVHRNELTKGFALKWDGTEIAHRTWSLVGLGELHAFAEADGKHHDVKVAIHWGGLSEMNGKCTITVDGKDVPVHLVK
jgi:hypothetical protein